MKKTVALILIFSMLFCFAACGKKTNGTVNDPSAGVSDQSDTTKADAATTATTVPAATKQEETGVPAAQTDPTETETEPTADPGETTTAAPSAPKTTAAEEKQESRALVAFFSPDNTEEAAGEIENGNTRIVAQMIAEALGADTFEITPATPYPTAYSELRMLPVRETRNPPKVANRVDSIRDYDTLYIGYPIWYGDMPAIVEVFLSSYDLYGITVIPFCTHSGSGLGRTPAALATLCAGSPIGKGLAVQGSDAVNAPQTVKSQVSAWLAEKTAAENSQERG